MKLNLEFIKNLGLFVSPMIKNDSIIFKSIYDDLEIEIKSDTINVYTQDPIVQYDKCIIAGIKSEFPNFKELKRFQINTFKHRIVQTNKMMACDGYANSDKDIVQEVYKDYSTAKKELYKQIGYTQKSINLIFADDSILKVNPIIKRPVLDVLRMGYEYAVNHLISNLKEIFEK